MIGFMISDDVQQSNGVGIEHSGEDWSQGHEGSVVEGIFKSLERKSILEDSIVVGLGRRVGVSSNVSERVGSIVGH